MEGAEQGACLSRLQREHDNLRAALGWTAQHGEAESELRLAGGLAYFWWTGGYLREGRYWLEDAVARCPDRRDGLRLRALEGLGWVTAYLGDYVAAAGWLEEALALARALGDRRSVTHVLATLIVTSYWQGHADRWPALAAELEASRQAGDTGNLHWALDALGMFALEAGDQAAATAYFEDALAVRQRTGDQAGIASVLACLGLVAQAQGDPIRAADLAAEGLRRAREWEHPLIVAWCSHVAVCVAADWVPAAGLARLLGAADSLAAMVSLRVGPRQRARYDQLGATVRAALGEPAFTVEWAQGRSMTPDECQAASLGALESGAAEEAPLRRQTAPAPPDTSRVLSPREREVLRLVAQGLSDRAIAQALIISENTAKFHLKSIFRKLGARTRAQAAALAAERGLL
jgi:DNA-binding CsgD family transcriptional regulator/tetratricopeptide (TPR) repeat protein